MFKPSKFKRISAAVQAKVGSKWNKGVKKVKNRCDWVEMKFGRKKDDAQTENKKEWIERVSEGNKGQRKRFTI